MIVKKLTKFPDEIIDETKIPFFATPGYAKYLKGVESQNVFWFAGIKDDSIIYLIPFSVTAKAFLRKGCFLTETLSLTSNNGYFEKEFLDSVIDYIKINKTCDWIEQTPNWAIFNNVPSDSVFCEFGTYKINLIKYDEEELFRKMKKDKRRSIRAAIKENYIIKKGSEYLDDCMEAFEGAAKGGNYTLPEKKEITSMLRYLPNNINIFTAYENNIPQCSVIMYYNRYSTYGIHAGRVPSASRNINNWLIWHTILDAKRSGIKYFDFAGARVNPKPGSKLYKIQVFKEHFGTKLVSGFLWKMKISKVKYFVYALIMKMFFLIRFKKYEGDIIDQEIKRK